MQGVKVILKTGASFIVETPDGKLPVEALEPVVGNKLGEHVFGIRNPEGVFRAFVQADQVAAVVGMKAMDPRNIAVPDPRLIGG